jgi:hypothetical protein
MTIPYSRINTGMEKLGKIFLKRERYCAKKLEGFKEIWFYTFGSIYSSVWLPGQIREV